MKEIEISGGLYATVSDCDFEDLSRFNWRQYKGGNGGGIYARRDARFKKQRQGVSMHRIVMERLLCRHLFDEEIVDHIDGNTLNNTRENIRLASPAQNVWNRHTPLRNISGYHGVYWHKPSQKWRVILSVNYKRVYGGEFTCKHEAARLYNKLALQHRGQFARLNIVEVRK